MNMIDVDSSMISAVGYDEEGERMAVLFNSGKLYTYYEVPKEVYEELMASGSKGSYMRDCVIDCYPYELGRQRSRRRW